MRSLFPLPFAGKQATVGRLPAQDQGLTPQHDVLFGKDWDKIVVAYEPVWAIGTGKVATPDQAQA